MYPHERSLVKQLAGKPFEIIGVNSDRDRDALKDTLEEKNITWRSFWNGGSTSGPISTKWGVTGWPTTYLIDAKGVIRYKGVRGANLDKAIIKLLGEMGHKVKFEDHEELGKLPEKKKEEKKDDKEEDKKDKK